MKIIIFGGAGFIGTNLTKKLCDMKHEITIYDRDLLNKNLPDCECELVDGDFFSENKLVDILKSQDIVIHLISSVSPLSSMTDIYAPYNQDVLKSLELLEASRLAGVRKIIFVSSGGTVYGENNEYESLSEDLFLSPVNHYGIMKSIIEKQLLLYNDLYGMENIVLRLANPYGPEQNPEKKIGAISVFLNNILMNKPIKIFGDGLIVRDYIEITDVCNSIALSLEYRNKQIQPIFNVGTGVGTSLLEIISYIENITNTKAKVEYVKTRSVDVRRNILNPDKAKKYLGFESEIKLFEGIKNLARFNKVNL